MKSLGPEQKCFYQMKLRMEQLPIPEKFQEKGWRLIHSKDGKLCQLDQNNGFLCWMGNGPNEKSDMIEGSVHMYGDCLVLGLGIGLIVQYIDVIGHCKSITIVEKSPIVIKHIGPWLKSVVKTPIEIIEDYDEKFLKETDRKWHTMYADTWELCTDALNKIENLKKASKGKVKFRKMFWAENRLKRMKKQGR